MKLIAENYFSNARGEYMKIENAFRKDKILLKLRIAKDQKHLSQSHNLDYLTDLSKFFRGED